MEDTKVDTDEFVEGAVRNNLMSEQITGPDTIIDRDKIREQLKQHVVYQKGLDIRKQLKQYAELYYTPKHSPDVYMRYLRDNECSFRIAGAQSTNHPYYWEMFSIPSQHVYGDCIEECFDNAIDVATGQKE